MRQQHTLTALLAVLAGAAAIPAAAQDTRGAAIYAERCAACHDQGADERAPARTTIAAMSPERIVAALSTGSMSLQTTGLGRDDIEAVALHVSDHEFGEVRAATVMPNECLNATPPFDPTESQWNGWGVDPENSRFQPDPGLAAGDVPRLRLKWAWAYPDATAYGQPTPIGNRVFVTSQAGTVSALDSESGCTIWRYQAGRGVRTALTVTPMPEQADRMLVLFADEGGSAHALDASTGERVWTTEIEDHPAVRITGSPKYFDGRLFVPISSLEEVASRGLQYACCTFRGAIAALDVASGTVLWKSHTIPEAPAPTRINTADVQMYGPAGGAIWGSPTIDAARGLVYAGTGNSYTDVPTEGTNAIVAFDIETGARRWIRQTTANDNYLLGCNEANAGSGNCPETAGPDHDFGASVILKTLPDGGDIIVAGQKSGTVYGLDPDNDGAILWQTSVGDGSPLGGIEWGMAADADTVYVANSDIYAESPRPGLSAIRISDGTVLWHVPASAPECSWGGTCRNSQSAAVTAMPGVVFAGSFDGHIRAYDSDDGEVIWDFDTGRLVNTVNGVTEGGGHLDGPGPTVAGGQVYVNSGAGTWGGHQARLLLVFSVDGQ